MIRKAILFDFDGVMADTFDFCFIIRKKFSPYLTIKEYRKWFEGNINERNTDIISDEERQKLNERFFALYRPKLMKTKIIQGMTAVVESLSKKYYLFIVSSTNSDIIRDFLNREGLLKYFVQVLGNEIEYSKVKKIQMIQKEYKIQSEDCVFVTDTLGDIIEADKCKIKSIAVTWGYHSKNILQKGNPIKIINSPTQIIDAIETTFA